jgi:hypothetical protein
MRPKAKEDRVAELRRLGVSATLLRLATGKNRCQFFADFRVPWKVYRGISWTRGPEFVPLWEKYDTVTAIRAKGKGREFISFSVESPRSPRVLATTEQGLFATLFFDPLNMWYDDPEDCGLRYHRGLVAAADSLGFLYFPQADEVFRTHYPRGYDAFQRAFAQLVRDIDAGRVSE